MAKKKKDIRNRADIERLIIHFYDKVKKDRSIGYIFNDVARINWEKHIPVFCDFWENILFYSGNYSGNPTDLHRHLSKISSLKLSHFKRWNDLFRISVEDLFEGEKATLAIQKSISISIELRLTVL